MKHEFRVLVENMSMITTMDAPEEIDEGRNESKLEELILSFIGNEASGEGSSNSKVTPNIQELVIKLNKKNPDYIKSLKGRIPKLLKAVGISDKKLEKKVYEILSQSEIEESLFYEGAELNEAVSYKEESHEYGTRYLGSSSAGDVEIDSASPSEVYNIDVGGKSIFSWDEDGEVVNISDAKKMVDNYVKAQKFDTDKFFKSKVIDEYLNRINKKDGKNLKGTTSKTVIGKVIEYLGEIIYNSPWDLELPPFTWKKVLDDLKSGKAMKTIYSKMARLSKNGDRNSYFGKFNLSPSDQEKSLESITKKAIEKVASKGDGPDDDHLSQFFGVGFEKRKNLSDKIAKARKSVNESREISEVSKSDLKKTVEKYMKKLGGDKVTKKSAPLLHAYLKKTYKKEKMFMIKDLLELVEGGKKSFKEFRSYSNKLWDKATKIAKEKNSSALNVIVPPAITKATMALLKDWENNVISTAKKDGVDLMAMQKGMKEEIFHEVDVSELVETRDVSGDCVTRFGMANNKKFNHIKLVKSMSDRNKLVPDNFLKRTIREMESMLGDKNVRQVGRTMYFEVPKYKETKPEIVAREMMDFLEDEGYVTESTVNEKDVVNSFLNESSKPNKFLMKGNSFLKEEDDSDYQNWLKGYDEVNVNVDSASKKLRSIAGDNKGGMTPDSIKSSSKFKKAKAEFDKANKIAQNFAKKSPKEYLKRRSKERRASWKK